ncbi:MAG TPA: hypothetical protein VK427_08750 [Kofleriaceae bacterium]|nr:hypothetical protein [Kofleriaceae bacterium]
MKKSYLSALCLVVACGGGGGNNDGNTPPADAAQGTPDAYQPPSGFERLIGGAWTLPAGAQDRYKCVRFTVPADTYITNIVAQAPKGTHHTVLSISDSTTQGPDGQYECNVSELGMVMLYASGVGTSPLNFPSGVGVKVAAGTQVHLNLHLYNASDAAISGESAIWVKSQPTPTPTLAEMVFAGKFLFQIPGMSQNYNVSGKACTANRDYKVFALWPHMHQMATHSKFEVVRKVGMNTEVLHDKAYDFAEQGYYLQSPEIQINNGDELRITCTYTNPTNQPVYFGDSSNKEMCFVGMYQYPAANSGLFECTDTNGAGF